MNGNGYKIIGLKTVGSNASLFGYCKGATIKGLVIESANVNSKEEVNPISMHGEDGDKEASKETPIGVLCSVVTDDTKISDVTINGAEVTGTSKVGGLVGESKGKLEISNVTLSNVTINGDYNTAGLVGAVDANYQIDLKGTNSVNVTFGSSSSEDYTEVKSNTINGLTGNYIGSLKSHEKLFYATQSKYYNVIVRSGLSEGLKGSELSVNEEKSTKVYKTLDLATNYNFGSNSSETNDLTFEADGLTFITNWTDAWVFHNITLKGINFLNGAVFNVNADKIKVSLENCTFNACDMDKALKEEGHYSYSNLGEGMCLDLENRTTNNTSMYTVEFEVKSCQSVGENDESVNCFRKIYINTTEQNEEKKRGHGIVLNAISGGNKGITTLSYSNSSIAGVRGNAIQIYVNDSDNYSNATLGVSMSYINIYSWGVCNGLKKSGSSDAADIWAIRGDFKTGTTIEGSNIYFGLNEAFYTYNGINRIIGHINIGGFSGNTPFGEEGKGTARDAGIYSITKTTNN